MASVKGQHRGEIADGFSWAVDVCPRPRRDPLIILRIRGQLEGRRRVDVSREVTAADMPAAIAELGDRLGVEPLGPVRVKTEIREVVRMEKVDLKDVDLEEIIAAKQARLDELDNEVARIEEQREPIRRQIAVLRKATSVDTEPEAPRVTRKPKKLPQGRAKATDVAAPGALGPRLPTHENVRSVMISEPGKQWLPSQIAEALGGADVEFVREALSQMARAGFVEPGWRGRWLLTESARGAA